ncbi:MlaC/ttg2D family ABC transporter substrate-binding protein [Thiomonas bhubaneswarensis]|uniref:ABC-type transporter Mla maintaining outer membrane lipid asymmetry, periplasmic MlaC component n=1 Tax=Thiomonas bhubaneswarensis TaxID=339866 RepID=A0A0K6HVE2_9BURK|nr:ABC transporter substrate-binding protein [Thiomonas bhubaneswarensis]CUA94865.1 ABC-type transporter Mla maintaining outer membrane lipid asymmetry, periplasmic MlaC component [Thiomonas bhubaneswarensis]
MLRRTFIALSLASATVLAGMSGVAQAADAVTPPQLIESMSNEIIRDVQQDPKLRSGNPEVVMQFVEQKILPNVDFQKITQSAVGRYWREATPAQRTALEQQFKQLLVYTYAGAVRQIKDQKVKLLPYREPANAQDVTVRTRVINNGEPLQLDYRLEQTPAGWKITDVNVMGIWLVDNYRSVFAQEISQKGIDGLIATLKEKNQTLAQAKVAG